MYNWNRVGLRAYSRAVFALVLAVVSMMVVSGWQPSPSLAGVAQAARWVPWVLLAATLGLAATPTYWLLRWERGHGPACPSCGGPLGHEKAGYANRGGAFRRCYGCGTAVNHICYR
jgi:hypothetical protein